MLGQWFARLSDNLLWTSDPPPSGNASAPHSVPRMRYRSLGEQRSISIIAFAFSWSLIGGGRDNTTISMACLRAGDAPEGGSDGGDDEEEQSGEGESGDDEDGDEDAAPGMAIGSPVAFGFIAALWALMLLV